KITLPLYSSASSSTIGATMRQGPHHGAQKSTRTGSWFFSTSWSHSASVTSAGFAILFPPSAFRFIDPRLRCCYYTPEGYVNARTTSDQTDRRRDGRHPHPPSADRRSDPRHPSHARRGPRLRRRRDAVDGCPQQPRP